MKLALALVLAGLCSSTFAATYKCAETAEKALEEGRLQYSVILKEGRKITDPKIVKDNDAAGYVKVSVLSRDPEVGGRFELDRPSFTSIATYADVLFNIEDKRNGFQFWMYMDEEDETGMKLRGVKGSMHLKCKYEE